MMYWKTLILALGDDMRTTIQNHANRGADLGAALTITLVLLLLCGGCLGTGPDVERLPGDDDDSAGDDDDSAGDDDDSAPTWAALDHEHDDGHEHDGYADLDHEHGNHADADHVHEADGFDWAFDCSAWAGGPVFLSAVNFSLEYEVLCHHGTRLDEAEADVDANREDIDINAADIDGHTHPVGLPTPAGSIGADPVVWAGDCEIEDVGGLSTLLPPILYSFPAAGELFFGGSSTRAGTTTATASGLGCPSMTSCGETWGDGGTLEDGDLWTSSFPSCVLVGGAVALHRPGGWSNGAMRGLIWETAVFIGAAPATVTTEVTP